jgi:NAD(P)-dependent dehydrogenase (short-subunit alcohol dehydrogenase family)
VFTVQHTPFYPLLRQRGKDKTKKILNISTIIGSIIDVGMANPACRMPAVCVSKAALNMVTKLHAIHLAKENLLSTLLILDGSRQILVARMHFLNPKTLLLAC